jgi:glucosylglycerate phosphorylase
MKPTEVELSLLTQLYGPEAGRETYHRLAALVENHRARIAPPRRASLDQRDAILITYGDMLRQPGAHPLHTLADFCSARLEGAVSGVHILPFFPYTSDDGFSVIDYTAVDPALGDWEDIERLRQHFRLMFDAVINHCSVQSRWFQGYLAGEPRYQDYFINVPDGADLSQVVRPRALPLLTSFSEDHRVLHIWTTFSADQVDLNYHNPAVLLDVLDVLLTYVERGAELIRLDAIAYLWKEYGTRCIHLPQTHQVIQLMRALLDDAAPNVLLITETNVPHVENLSYFGDGANEAQLVYNFALPPLVLHTFRTGNAQSLSKWAGGLSLPSRQVTFFNFLASHDGIGLNPARGILTEHEINALVERTLEHGGFVSYKNNPDGSTSPYELNINYFDALSNPNGDEPIELQAERFLASQAIMLALLGMPGIYFHSLFGSRGWREGVLETHQNRTINRQKLNLDEINAQLADPASLRARVTQRYTRLLRTRAAQPAFDPFGDMQVLDAGPQVFAVRRETTGAAPVVCLQNVCAEPQAVPASALGLDGSLHDLVEDREIALTNGSLLLAPYQVLWLI